MQAIAQPPKQPSPQPLTFCCSQVEPEGGLSVQEEEEEEEAEAEAEAPACSTSPRATVGVPLLVSQSWAGRSAPAWGGVRAEGRGERRAAREGLCRHVPFRVVPQPLPAAPVFHPPTSNPPTNHPQPSTPPSLTLLLAAVVEAHDHGLGGKVGGRVEGVAAVAQGAGLLRGGHAGGAVGGGVGGGVGAGHAAELDGGHALGHLRQLLKRPAEVVREEGVVEGERVRGMVMLRK